MGDSVLTHRVRKGRTEFTEVVQKPSCQETHNRGELEHPKFEELLPPPRHFEGKLAKNSLLAHTLRLMENNVFGPESFAVHNTFGTVYTGLKTGHLVELKATGEDAFKVQRSIQLRYGSGMNNCTGSYSSVIECGRPLGLRFRKKFEDLLLIADAYYGLYEFNVVTADHRTILQPGSLITSDSAAKPVRFLNDVDEMEDGETLILSEPSTKFADRDYMYALAEHGGDGRLLSYNTVNGELKVLVDGLQYPNGVQVERGGKCIVFSEMGNLRILRHCVGASEPYTVVVDNLPGYPDNIRFSRDGNLWVPLGSVRLSNDDWLTQRPFLRDLIAKVTTVNLFHSIIEMVSWKYGLVLLVDLNSGEILETLHDPTAKQISSISQVEELPDGSLLLGGDENPFIGVLLEKYRHP